MGAAFGLSDTELRSHPTTSTLSIATLVKHSARCAAGWLDRAGAAPGPWPAPGDTTTREDRMQEHLDQFRLTDDDTRETLLAELEAVIDRVAHEVPAYNLDERVPVPRDAPWWPRDIDFWSIRWVLLHMVEELARHAGHADIIRESIDGATMFELMAAVEAWPATDWLKPWSPPAPATR